MNSTKAIGIFDSGIGGISIWKEIITLLPNENTIYLADSRNAPYGQKLKQKIIEYSVKNTELLIEKGCKIIVVACNTATTNAIDYLRKHYTIPFIGIEPAIKPAALNTQSNSIGILATKGTLTSSLFHITSKRFTEGIHVIEQVGEGLVPLIESGAIDTLEMEKLLKKYITPMLESNIDYLVLGCSHYPFLIPKIQKILGKEVKIIDSGEAVANQTKAVLENRNLLYLNPKNSVKHKLFSNGTISVLKRIVNDVEPSCKVAYLDF